MMSDPVGEGISDEDIRLFTDLPNSSRRFGVVALLKSSTDAKS